MTGWGDGVMETNSETRRNNDFLFYFMATTLLSVCFKSPEVDWSFGLKLVTSN